jgi:hypothetical protein
MFVASISRCLVVVIGLAVFGSAGLRAEDAAPTPAVPPGDFLFQNVSQPVLFIGDDATAQRMFTTLIETYTLSRFPDWKITFRNVGWEGDKMRFAGIRAPSGDQAIRRDIEAFHPQAVLANYGSTDSLSGEAGLQQFIVGVNVLARDLPRVGIKRAAFLSVVPREGYDAGQPGGSKDNLTLQKFADGMEHQFPIGWQNGVEFMRQHPKGPEVPQLQNGLFIDLFNPLLSLIDGARKSGALSPDGSLGDKTLRLMPDGIHPNWAGHLVIAATILTGLHAPDVVSAATLDASAHSVVKSQGCTITWQDAPAGVIQFARTDSALPWPTPPEADLALKLPGFDPATTLNRYELKVANLKGTSYRLSIDGQPVATYAGADLANGINLGFARQGPIYDRGQKIFKAVLEKNDTFYHRWREVQIGPPPLPGASAADARQTEAARQTEIKPELARLDKMIADQEQAIHLLCQPASHVFRLEPANP